MTLSLKRRIFMGRDYFCRSPNRAKRMECVQLAAAFAALRPIQTFGHSRKRQQAARTPYASRGSVTDRNNRAPLPPSPLLDTEARMDKLPSFLSVLATRGSTQIYEKTIPAV